ncbi:hypothetical protein FRX31_008541 [Thalictrum thalictroides]|uniref:DUF3741 domain-containing protein n=1 Tax=Thalictrum thalictroides TaxID=46969 RepID=A0A7J6WWR1_THATH|nr:hypothetical protein FRX31_008541 [Thalictrum thalictroides]
MKDLSVFLLKNTLAARMRKGFKNFCNGDGSTSTLNQNQNMSCMVNSSLDGSPYLEGRKVATRTPTLEEMILQLELEEEAARKAKNTEYEDIRRRMSCVSNSDVLRSARNALNQYPRFSLDGKDSMYRSSFKNTAPVIGGYVDGRKSVCCGTGITGRILGGEYGLDFERHLNLPQTSGGKNVVWCKPGVVAKLMGLEAMPVPISSRKHTKGRTNCTVKKQNLRRVERYENDKRKFTRAMNSCKDIGNEIRSSCSTTNSYSVMKPVSPIERPATKRQAGMVKKWETFY